MADQVEEKKVKTKKEKIVLTPEQKKSRVMEILKKEYAFENWLLAILAPVLVLYGVYIIIGAFGSVDLTAILGSSGIGFIDFFFETDLKRILTGVFLILVGTLVIVYLAIPILRPSIAEMKKVSWPPRKDTLSSTAVVIVTVLIIVAFLGVVDFALGKIVQSVLSY